MRILISISWKKAATAKRIVNEKQMLVIVTIVICKKF